jgi:putative ABC transport system substrate-binding protein
MTEASSQKSEVSKTRSLRTLLVAFGSSTALIFELCISAEAQQLAKIPRAGYLGSTSSSANSTRDAAFQQELRNLGYIQGKNILIEYRYADGQLELLPELAKELVRLKVDVIVAGGLPAAHAAKRVTTTIPIVFTGGDPVRTGLVFSLARPGGNLTGVTDPTVDVSTKRLELLRESVRELSRIAMLWNPLNPTNPLQMEDTKAAARVLGIRLFAIEARDENDFEHAFAAIASNGSGALLVAGDPLFASNRKRMAYLAAKHRLPAMFTARDYVEAGGLMAYGEDPADRHRRLAWYVDKILKGQKPADLPIQAAAKFELVINLKTANQIGLTIPPNVLARADRVIR